MGISITPLSSPSRGMMRVHASVFAALALAIACVAVAGGEETVQTLEARELGAPDMDVVESVEKSFLPDVGEHSKVDRGISTRSVVGSRRATRRSVKRDGPRGKR